MQVILISIKKLNIIIFTKLTATIKFSTLRLENIQPKAALEPYGLGKISAQGSPRTLWIGKNFSPRQAEAIHAIEPYELSKIEAQDKTHEPFIVINSAQDSPRTLWIGKKLSSRQNSNLMDWENFQPKAS